MFVFGCYFHSSWWLPSQELLEEVERTPFMYYQPNSEKFLRVVMQLGKQRVCMNSNERINRETPRVKGFVSHGFQTGSY